MLGEEVALDVDVEPETGEVRIDPGALEQIIVNLAVNARDAMSGGGRLRIGVSNLTTTSRSDAAGGRRLPAGRYVMIRVKDEGVGMDAETMERIFEPFFTTKEAGRGTGLGLSICYGIVEQSGGFLRVASIPGRGSTFDVLLPRVDATGTPPVMPVGGAGTR
ncbi:MAG: hypothetical protein JJU22_08820 [Gammaproteobacteria bacterium]|nr:hypothetical protein [Gammaproteobacteria bacterium]